MAHSYRSEVDKLRLSLGAGDLEKVKLLDALKKKDEVIEESKPKWYQTEVAIAVWIGLAFAAGIGVAL